MANWCSNIVFIEEYTVPNKVNELVSWLTSKELGSMEQGVRPDFVPEECKYLFHIHEIYHDDYISFRFESKWSPAIRTMVAMAKHYGFSFKLEVEEGGECLYGEYEFNIDDKELRYRSVPYDLYPKDDDNGESPESLYDELEELLKEQPYRVLTL